MKKTIVIVALALLPSIVMAQERAGDAALGALSGAVVLGPVGAVAGAVVGYTAGPSIARSWGLRRSSGARHARKPVRREARASRPAGQAAATSQTAPPAGTAASTPVPQTASSAPPVQALE